MNKPYKLMKPDRAGKNYRPKEEPKHVFFFKGYYIMIGESFRDVWICKGETYFSTHCDTLDNALVQAMEEIYKLRDKNYENELQKMAKDEKEKEVRKHLSPYIDEIVKRIMETNHDNKLRRKIVFEEV